MDGVAKLFCAKNIWFLVGAKWNSHYHHLEILEHCIKSESYLLRLPCTGWLPPDFQDPHVSTSPENYHQVRRSLGFFHIVSRTLRFGWARTSCCGSHGIVNRLGGGSSKSPSHLEEWGVYMCVSVEGGGDLFDQLWQEIFTITIPTLLFHSPITTLWMVTKTWYCFVFVTDQTMKNITL